MASHASNCAVSHYHQMPFRLLSSEHCRWQKATSSVSSRIPQRSRRVTPTRLLAFTMRGSSRCMPKQSAVRSVMNPCVLTLCKMPWFERSTAWSRFRMRLNSGPGCASLFGAVPSIASGPNSDDARASARLNPRHPGIGQAVGRNPMNRRICRSGWPGCARNSGAWTRRGRDY